MVITDIEYFDMRDCFAVDRAIIRPWDRIVINRNNESPLSSQAQGELACMVALERMAPDRSGDRHHPQMLDLLKQAHAIAD